MIRPALVVPESRRIGDLFNQMRRERKHMAIVIDEYGGTAGLVTSEELAEEVVGRLTDEWVTSRRRFSAEGGVYEIDGQTRVDEVNEALGVTCPLRPTMKRSPDSCSSSDAASRSRATSSLYRQTAVHHRQKDGRPEDRACAGGASVTSPAPCAIIATFGCLT